jgi:hypothetical protein
MAIDLEAIRRKVQELSGVRRNSLIQLWKPAVGEYKVRGLPWKNTEDGTPFVEKWFYYIGTGPGILAPYQFGKPDPIHDFMKKLYASGKPDDRLLAKKLQPKMRAYIPIVIRGQEDSGVMVWSLGKMVYQKLLSYFLNEEVGNILDPKDGFDLNVIITQQPGKQFQDISVEAARRPKPLSDNPEQVKKWLDSVPNLDDMYKLKTSQEIEKILDAWLNGGDQAPTPSDGTPGTGNVASTSDELDALAKEVKLETQPEKQEEAILPKKPKRVSKEAADKLVESAQNSLDAAFDELTKD